MPAPLHIDVKQPCHENWQQMTPNEQGRHCLSCQKTVVDFTRMSDQEILHYISNTSSSVCGRFYNHQLDKTYEEKKIKPAFTFRYAWNLITAAFLLTGSAATAQVKKKEKKKTAVKKEWAFKYKLESLFDSKYFKDLSYQAPASFTTLGFVVSSDSYVEQYARFIEPPLKMFGFIHDSYTGQPIEAATIRLKGVKAGVEAGEDGRFEFPIVDISGKVTLEVTAKGYVTKEYEVDINSFRAMNFSLESDGSIVYDDVRNWGTTMGDVIAKPTMGKVVVEDTTLVEVKIEETVCEGITMGTPAVVVPNVDDFGVIIGYGREGVILDDKTGEAVSFASVRIKGEKGGVAANEAGVFNIIVPAEKGKLTLEVSAIGYASQELEIAVKDRKQYTVRLQPAADDLKPVEVVLLSSISCGRGAPNPFIKKDELPISMDSLLGGKISCPTVIPAVATVQKVEQAGKELLPVKQDVRIYPNPVMPGNAFNINLNLDKTGEYKLELMDAAGRVVHVRILQIAQNTQVVNVPTQSSWSHGIYWIRITNATDKKVYQAKLLLQ
jgi:hypothetical protein